MVVKKYIAISRDGLSDYLVVKKFVKSIFQQHHLIELEDANFFDLEDLKIVDDLAKYVDKAKKQNDYTLFGQYAKEFKNAIISVLTTSCGKFQREKEVSLSNQDIIILYADAEKKLGRNSHYFDTEMYSISNTAWLAVEEFYDKMIAHGYSYESLPLILPLILFPSSEILVAACMYESEFAKEGFRTMNAKPDLKVKVYGTDNIPVAGRDGSIEEILNAYLVPDSLKHIYREIPEARKFMQILSNSVIANKSL